MTQALALALSLLVEAAAAALLARVSRWSAPSPAALAAVLGTLATHPLVWLFVESAEDVFGYGPALAVAETLAVLVEALGYRRLATPRFRRALAFSAAANAASFGLGEMLYAFDLA